MDTKPTPVELATYDVNAPEGVFTVTLTQHGPNSFDVDMWKENGDNHWNRWFNTEAQARVEFERWRK
jgi:hypothetical protein